MGSLIGVPAPITDGVYVDDNSAAPEDVAAHFLKTEEAVWTAWVPADVAAKVKASLN